MFRIQLAIGHKMNNQTPVLNYMEADGIIWETNDLDELSKKYIELASKRGTDEITIITAYDAGLLLNLILQC